jgi:hypothetical protein
MSIESDRIPDVDRGGGQSKPAAVAADATSAAADVAATAGDGVKQAAGEVVTQVHEVAGEAKRQLSSVVDQTRAELTAQATARTSQAASGLRTLADQVQALAQGRLQEAGDLAGYLDDARARIATFSTRLDQGGPQALIDDVSSFARRRPVVFLAAAAGAGFLVGRLARAGRAATQSAGPSAPTNTPALAPPTPAPVVFDAPSAASLP